MTQETNYIIPSLDRAIQVVHRLANSPDGLSQHELAKVLGYPENSVFRILRTLSKHRWVVKEEDSSKYLLSGEVCILGFKVANRYDLVEMARPLMVELGRRTRETMQLFVLYRNKGLMVHQIESTHPIKVSGQVGSHYDLHCSGAGKVLLAGLSETEVRAIVDVDGLTGHTPHTITSLHALEIELAAIRQKGYALDNEEYTLGIRCIAAPVFNHLGRQIAGVNISGPTSRLSDEALPPLIEAVCKTAARISEKLGFERKDQR
jgi:IclR family transcriptional regulator, KDG regulon repressor